MMLAIWMEVRVIRSIMEMLYPPRLIITTSSLRRGLVELDVVEYRQWHMM